MHRKDLNVFNKISGVTNNATTATSTRSLPRRSNDAKEKDRASQTQKNSSKSDDSDVDDDDDNGGGRKERHLRHKLMPVEADDFKIVFISSDSSKESDQLNSSLEACPEPEQEPENRKEDGPEEMEWSAGHRVRGSDFAATSR